MNYPTFTKYVDACTEDFFQEFNVHGNVHRQCIIKHNQRDATCTIFFIVVSFLRNEREVLGF